MSYRLPVHFKLDRYSKRSFFFFLEVFLLVVCITFLTFRIAFIHIQTIYRDQTTMKRDTSCSPNGKEGSGHAFLLDPATAASSLWNGRRGRRLLRKHVGAADKKMLSGDLGHLEEPLRRLSFTDKELQEVIDDREQFRSLQSQLRKRGAVTNTMVKEGLHFYVQTCLECKRQSDSPRTMITPTAASTKSGRHRRHASFGTPPDS